MSKENQNKQNPSSVRMPASSKQQAQLSNNYVDVSLGQEPGIKNPFVNSGRSTGK